MKISALVVLTLLGSYAGAQEWTSGVPVAPPPGKKGNVVIYRRELGKWWQNSDIVKKLQISDAQVTQLEDIFYEHRIKLIDYGADMEKQDLKLQNLLDADVPEEAQIGSQVDQVLEARGKLEREFTMMNLDLRKVLSLGQWRQLKSIRGDTGAVGGKIFFRKVLPPGELPPPPDQFNIPLPPPDNL
jgi:Spy/CpxP family protein refolding chaperone